MRNNVIEKANAARIQTWKPARIVFKAVVNIDDFCGLALVFWSFR